MLCVVTSVVCEQTPLGVAALNDNLFLCRYLIDRGATVELGAFSALHAAVKGLHSQNAVVEYLLQCGAIVDFQVEVHLVVSDFLFFLIFSFSLFLFLSVSLHISISSSLHLNLNLLPSPSLAFLTSACLRVYALCCRIRRSFIHVCLPLFHFDVRTALYPTVSGVSSWAFGRCCPADRSAMQCTSHDTGTADSLDSLQSSSLQARSCAVARDSFGVSL
jgi:hypothetical protein